MAAPEAEVELSSALVRSLLREQHPDLAGLPVVELASGWDNVVYRLGEDLLVRLPRRALGAELVAHEQRWLPQLAPLLPLPVPAPVRFGVAGAGYPWSWSVVPWFRGDEAARRSPSDWNETAERLGAFLVALHRPAPADAPANPYRGVPLAERSERLSQGLELLGDKVDRVRIEELWASLVGTAPWPGPPVWLHGDLHPRNLVIDEGRLAAVVDFGDITSGDPASDLSVAWFWFPRAVRSVFRRAAGEVDDDTWRRAKGWALALGVAHLGGDESTVPLGRRALEEVLGDEG